jgi:pimeloyl-ACP methyl ester carboxylesterase
VVAVAAVLAGCGDGGTAPASRPAAIVSETLGRGPQQVTILRPDTRATLPVVVFLHGWGAPSPDFYRPWLEHLARRGSAVVYPHYQESFISPPAQALGNVLAGIRLALARPRLDPGSLVVAGHSAGGALAADYAAIAATAGLPPARAVLAVYPGRRLRRVPRGLPEIPPERIPADTTIEALASRNDGIVGTETAREIVRGATAVPRDRRRFVLVTDPAVDDHQAPLRVDAAARGAFWARLDRLIAAVRRDRRTSTAAG